MHKRLSVSNNPHIHKKRRHFNRKHHHLAHQQQANELMNLTDDEFILQENSINLLEGNESSSSSAAAAVPTACEGGSKLTTNKVKSANASSGAQHSVLPVGTHALAVAAGNSLKCKAEGALLQIGACTNYEDSDWNDAHVSPRVPQNRYSFLKQLGQYMDYSQSTTTTADHNNHSSNNNNNSYGNQCSTGSTPYESSVQLNPNSNNTYNINSNSTTLSQNCNNCNTTNHLNSHSNSNTEKNHHSAVSDSQHSCGNSNLVVLSTQGVFAGRKESNLTNGQSTLYSSSSSSSSSVQSQQQNQQFQSQSKKKSQQQQQQQQPVSSKDFPLNLEVSKMSESTLVINSRIAEPMNNRLPRKRYSMLESYELLTAGAANRSSASSLSRTLKERALAEVFQSSMSEVAPKIAKHEQAVEPSSQSTTTSNSSSGHPITTQSATVAAAAIGVGINMGRRPNTTMKTPQPYRSEHRSIEDTFRMYEKNSSSSNCMSGSGLSTSNQSSAYKSNCTSNANVENLHYNLNSVARRRFSRDESSAIASASSSSQQSQPPSSSANKYNMSRRDCPIVCVSPFGVKAASTCNNYCNDFDVNHQQLSETSHRFLRSTCTPPKMHRTVLRSAERCQRGAGGCTCEHFESAAVSGVSTTSANTNATTTSTGSAAGFRCTYTDEARRSEKRYGTQEIVCGNCVSQNQLQQQQSRNGGTGAISALAKISVTTPTSMRVEMNRTMQQTNNYNLANVSQQQQSNNMIEEKEKENSSVTNLFINKNMYHGKNKFRILLNQYKNSTGGSLSNTICSDSSQFASLKSQQQQLAQQQGSLSYQSTYRGNYFNCIPISTAAPIITNTTAAQSSNNRVVSAADENVNSGAARLDFAVSPPRSAAITALGISQKQNQNWQGIVSNGGSPWQNQPRLPSLKKYADAPVIITSLLSNNNNFTHNSSMQQNSSIHPKKSAPNQQHARGSSLDETTVRTPRQSLSLTQPFRNSRR